MVIKLMSNHMKIYSNFQKVIAILMAFLILTELTGCYSTQNLSASDIKQSDHFVIVGNKINVNAYDIQLSDSIMTGHFKIPFIDTSIYIHAY